MSGWRTFHANIVSKDELPKKDKIVGYIDNRGSHSRTSLHGDNLYIIAMERDSSHLKEFAKEYSEAFDTIGIGQGDDTGVGNDSVTFYSVHNGQLEEEDRRECPTVYDGLRVESTR